MSELREDWLVSMLGWVRMCLLVLDLGQNKPAKVPASVTRGITVDAIFGIIEAWGAGEDGKWSRFRGDENKCTWMGSSWSNFAALSEAYCCWHSMPLLDWLVETSIENLGSILTGFGHGFADFRRCCCCQTSFYSSELCEGIDTMGAKCLHHLILLARAQRHIVGKCNTHIDSWSWIRHGQQPLQTRPLGRKNGGR